MARTRSAVAVAAAGEAVTVTSENFEALLLASARQAATIAAGTRHPARTYTVERTERDTAVAPPPRFTQSDVQALRAKLRVSQGVFARLVGVSVKLEQAWESGIRTPSGPAARVLEALTEQPQAFQHLLYAKAATAVATSRRKTAKTPTAPPPRGPSRGAPRRARDASR